MNETRRKELEQHVANVKKARGDLPRDYYPVAVLDLYDALVTTECRVENLRQEVLILKGVLLRRQEEKPQGVYCCPGTRITIEADDVDQTVTYLQGRCPECGSTWEIEKDEAGGGQEES